MSDGLRILAWSGMPASQALTEAAARLGARAEIVAVSSNERLERLLADDP